MTWVGWLSKRCPDRLVWLLLLLVEVPAAIHANLLRFMAWLWRLTRGW